MKKSSTQCHTFSYFLMTKDRHLKYVLLPGMFTDMKLSTFQGLHRITTHFCYCINSETAVVSPEIAQLDRHIVGGGRFIKKSHCRTHHKQNKPPIPNFFLKYTLIQSFHELSNITSFHHGEKITWLCMVYTQQGKAYKLNSIHLCSW